MWPPACSNSAAPPALANIHGRSWETLVQRATPPGARAWFYEYNYEKQFPYTPNVRGVRTDDWKYITTRTATARPTGTSPSSIASPRRPRRTPQPRRRLPATFASVRAELERRLAELLAAQGLSPDRDRMPLDEGVRKELPDQRIR
jgi:hypothetical protein